LKISPAVVAFAIISGIILQVCGYLAASAQNPPDQNPPDQNPPDQIADEVELSDDWLLYRMQNGTRWYVKQSQVVAVFVATEPESKKLGYRTKVWIGPGVTIHSKDAPEQIFTELVKGRP
jgi:hypothetical protein